MILMPTPREFANRLEWLQYRSTRIGASDVAAICGLATKSAYALWAEKSGLVDPEPQTLSMARGLALECMISDAYKAETGYELQALAPYTVYEHATIPRMFCTPDRMRHHYTCVVELKSLGAQRSMRWEGQPYQEHIVQLQAQLACTGCPSGELVYYIDRGDGEIAIFPFDRHDRMIGLIEQAVTKFLECVDSGHAPEIDGAESTRRALLRMHPTDDGEEIELPHEVIDAARKREVINQRIGDLEIQSAHLANIIREAMAGASTGRGGGVRVTYRAQTRGGYLKVGPEYADRLRYVEVPYTATEPTTTRVLRVTSKEGSQNG